MNRYPGQSYAANQNVYDFLVPNPTENGSLPYPPSPGCPSRSSSNIHNKKLEATSTNNVKNGINFNPFAGVTSAIPLNPEPTVKRESPEGLETSPRRSSYVCSGAYLAIIPNSSSPTNQRRASYVDTEADEKLFPGVLMRNYRAEKGHLALRINPLMEKWFKAVDADDSGQITAQELQKALINGNFTNFSQDACRMMIDMYDQNSSGSIDLKEFQHLFDSINEWKSVFEGYDKDQSRTIDHLELCDAFQQMGYGLSSDFVQDLLVKYSPRTKQLTLDNFIIMCVQLKRVSDGFRSRDQSSHGKATLRYEDFVGLAMGLHH